MNWSIYIELSLQKLYVLHHRIIGHDLTFVDFYSEFPLLFTKKAAKQLSKYDISKNLASRSGKK